MIGLEIIVLAISSALLTDRVRAYGLIESAGGVKRSAFNGTSALPNIGTGRQASGCAGDLLAY
jgi:hypothetical protein